MSRQGYRRSSGKRTFFVKAAAVVIALCLIAALALPAFAAEADDGSAAAPSESYTYTVRIFPGTGMLPKPGTDDEYTDEPLIISGITPGSSLAQYLSIYDDFRWQKAKASSDKYYPTGIRESGKDNKQSKSDVAGIYTQAVTTSLNVDRDMDLVISYGMTKNKVKYTIKYLEQGSGKELRKEETFYGNEGEKPVVSYLYIEGYIPQYQNVTKTLVENAAQNVFPFYYVKMETPVTETETTTTTTNSTSGGTTTTGGGTTTTTRTTTTGGTTTRTTTGGTTTTTRTTTTGGTTTGGTTTGGTTTGTNAAGTTTGTNAAGTTTGTNAAGTTAGTNAAGTTAGTNAAGTTTGTGTAAGTTTTGTGTGTDANAGTQTANAVNTPPQTTGPQEIVDLDEQQTPLAQFSNGANNTNGTTNASTADGKETQNVNPETEGVVRAQGMSTPAKVILALAVILALGAAGWFFFRRFTMGGDEEDDDEDEDDDSTL